MSKKVLLLPTTKNVDEKMSIADALRILKENGVEFEITGNVVNGMYLSENGEIVEEELIPITGNVNAQQIATIFTQECVLEFDSENAKLVAQNGEIWAEFDRKIELLADTVENAVEIQRMMAKKFGGSSRIDKKVWSWVQKTA